ncbi:uncharacterized protein LOC121385871 [Gigantopelta aegis]|uniref:uncharacterized protein LOC121385871 n=1 Tax=Gigantopelta aegis TaxID=1735272 RepID=UPI001B88C503|nr:uncharacterized protein LOC121385871 [Gigantopelta aegis]
MSVDSKESFWEEHQESLKRIRTHLVKGQKGPVKRSTPVRKTRTPPSASSGDSSTQYLIRSPVGRSHAPYGKYRRTPLPVLPKLQTPRQQSHFKDSKNLRKEKYEVVPPVRPKHAFLHARTPDHDSWGEESDESDDEDDVPHPLPFHAQYVTPAPVMFGPPFPVYYPPPPKGASRTGRYYDRKRRRSPEKGYGDIYRNHRRHASQPVRNSRRNKMRSKRPPRQLGPPVPNGLPMAYPTGYPGYPGTLTHGYLPGYHGTLTHGYPVPMLNLPFFYYCIVLYIYPRNAEDSEDDDIESQVEDHLIKVALDHYNKHPLFASDFVSDFITDFLEEELIPDILIDALTEADKSPQDHPYYIPTLYVCEEFLGDEIESMVRDVIRESMNEVVDDYLTEELLRRDPLEDWLTQLVDDAVSESCREIVRESVMDLAQEYLDDQLVLNIYSDLVADYIQSIGDDLLEDCMFDMAAEDFLEEHVIGPEVDEESFGVATDVIKHFDNKVTQQQLKAIRHQAGDKLVDSFCLEYLLSLVSRQGRVWTESDFASKYLDDLMTNLLLEQYFNVKTDRNKTLHCRPLHKLHEKVVTDVAMDVLLQQVSASLDEDLADVDEYERGVKDEVLPAIPTVVR